MGWAMTASYNSSSTIDLDKQEVKFDNVDYTMETMLKIKKQTPASRSGEPG